MKQLCKWRIITDGNVFRIQYRLPLIRIWLNDYFLVGCDLYTPREFSSCEKAESYIKRILNKPPKRNWTPVETI